MTDRRKDRIYADHLDKVDDFVFDRRVAEVFPDMIKRSVPGYSTVIAMTGVLAGEYVQDNSRIYDLGCSLGASSFAVLEGIKARECELLAIDNSEEMLKQARSNLALQTTETRVKLICEDVINTQINNASLVILNFTLQFIDLEQRLELLKKIHTGLRPGGILILSEKIAFADPVAQALQIEMHHAFKRANGYNDLEISQKRSALEKVLIPETLEQHYRRLKQAGFARADLWFQCFNFVSLVARK
jgi:tRNA (cmo5U34)-methyltransferase